ncbi:MAG: SMC-Scp complex subunit ScpB, partial [Myxococcaceae bacterium]|nr:SMC-Scp complex subunit ScpB [Myxococcaceae bacterium]
LPTLREFQELSKESEEVIEKELGPDAAAPKGVASVVADLKDDAFEQKLKESNIEADAALADLEQALADSDATSREAKALLETPEGEKAGDSD